MQERSKLIRAFLLTSFKFANTFSSAMEEEYYDDGNISVVLRKAIGVLPNLINPYFVQSSKYIYFELFIILGSCGNI